MLRQDTIAAVATPPGEGGIAIVRVSGPRARQMAAQIFRPQRGGDPVAFPGYSVHYGAFVGAESGEVLDDGLLTVFHTPHSYTGEDVCELACHGGRATTTAVLRAALQAGARLAEPGEFTQRAFLNGRLDLAQAEAVAEVIRARTESARRVAQRQLGGALSRAVGEIKDELIGILAAIEVTIDFSDEVGELEYAPLEARIAGAYAAVLRLLASADTGRILRDGLTVTIVGRPNVGKSSLLNALLRADRAIVTPIAGTTRDLIEESATLGGIPVVLSDTAGLRETDDPIEQIGVERARSALEGSDVALFVLDATAGVTLEDRRLTSSLAAAGRVVVALNKRDVVEEAEFAALERGALSALGVEAPVVGVSARTGLGLDTLEEALTRPYQAVPADLPNSAPPAPTPVTTSGAEEGWSTVVVASARHVQALEAAKRSLEHAGATTAERLPGDFIAIDVRGALDALGQITGETVSEEIIHRIFRDFCVGK